MARKIVIDNSNGEVRAAVIEDGKLADLFIERSRHPSVLGNIYKGRVENVLPGMQASFVDIGLEKNAFLYVDDAMASLPEIVKATKNGDDVELPISRGKSIKELLKTGQDVLVQVTKEPIGTKGARVVTDVTLAGRYVVLIPSVNYVGVSRKIVDEGVRDRLRKLANKAKPRGMGIIVRTVAEEQPDEEIVRDIEFLTRAWRKIRAKAARAKAPQMLHYDADLVYRMARDYFGDDVTEFTVNTIGDYNKVSDLLHIDEKEKDPRIRLYSDKKPVFEAYGIEDEIWKATRRKVWLNSGGYLIFDTTEALTVVDVNTGKFTGSKDLEDTAFRNNIEAAGEIARQLRLRNIGGIIIADFIDMESEDHRKRVLEELEKHLEKDKARTSVLGITKLGLIEMTRKKSQQGLVELTHRVCDVCEGRGKVISEETLALRAERLIKREAAATDMQALLIGLNPYVAEELSSQSSKAIKELEEQTYRDIFIKADSSLAREDVKVLAAGSLEEILALVQPVRKGELLEVTIGQPDQDRREYGIATYKGLPVLVEEAGDMVGRTVKV
ncbi:MAG TPA: Rne/Rng family ribonuclease, partial [Bacillota bacterium]|nr:Rne/Rng family ribonuclease [Bacillota bacterium]